MYNEENALVILNQIITKFEKVMETIRENETGIFFDSQSEESLQGALERFEHLAYNVLNKIRSTDNYFDMFSEKRFESFFKTYVEKF